MLPFLLILADGATTPGVSVSDVMSVLQAIASVGFSIWFGYYVITVMIPRITDQQQKTVDKLNEMHAVEMKEINAERKAEREQFLSELKAMREAYGQWRTAPR